MYISIHAPRAGSDFGEIGILDKPVNFNPRSPCGERQGWRQKHWLTRKNFNPRSPCGERRSTLQR